ncbi:MAG: hypothetical protein C4329_14485 [Chitinophagaceae bacterium]
MADSQQKAYLEGLMDLKKLCTIKFRSVEGGVIIIRGHIIKIDTVSGRDVIETDAGMVIGVDQLIAINDKSFENYC